MVHIITYWGNDFISRKLPDPNQFRSRGHPCSQHRFRCAQAFTRFFMRSNSNKIQFSITHFLPIRKRKRDLLLRSFLPVDLIPVEGDGISEWIGRSRSEEHTSELQSRPH